MAVAFTPPDDGSQGSGPTTATTTATTNTAGGPSTSTNSSQPSTSTSASSSNMSSPQQSPNNYDRGEQLLQAIYNAIYHYGGSPNFPLPPPSPSCSGNSPPYYGEAFFPRSQPTPRTPRTPASSGRNHFEYPRRQRLSSTGSENDYEDTSCYEQSSDLDSSSEEFDDHFKYMAARERMQVFPGRVPPRRKKKEQRFVWPTVVTAVVLAVGCGILVTRN